MNLVTIDNISTVRILVLGDSGVGKTRLTDLLARSPYTPTQSTRTVGDKGWCVQVRIHDYPLYPGMPLTPSSSSISSDSDTNTTAFAGTRPLPTVPIFLEFFDFDSTFRFPHSHRNILYGHIDGIILVYDLCNMHTHDNLHDFLYQPLKCISRYRHKRLRPILKRHHVPILIVGTKLDLLKTRRLRHTDTLAKQLNADEIRLNCLDASSFEQNSRNYWKLQQFFNNTIAFNRDFPANTRRI